MLHHKLVLLAWTQLHENTHKASQDHCHTFPAKQIINVTITIIISFKLCYMQHIVAKCEWTNAITTATLTRDTSGTSPLILLADQLKGGIY